MSAAPKRGLGRGLGALIPPAHEQAAPSNPRPGLGIHVADLPTGQPVVYAELPIDLVVPNPRQPRTAFAEEPLAELVHSIKEIGLLQPVVVRRAGTGYELVAGERRLRACREAGLVAIPAIIRDTEDDALLRDALLENLHRADLNALEEAAAYSQLLVDFGCTQEQLAQRIGRSRPQVSNTLRLLKLPPDVQRRVAAGVLSAGHARALLSMNDPEDMETMARRIVAEGLSVRSVEEMIIVGAGEGKNRTKRERKPKGRDQASGEAIASIGTELADRLDTRVSVEGFASPIARGKVVIECADLADLRRIVALLVG